MTSFLNRANINSDIAMAGDVECSVYRQKAINGYTAWMRSIFRQYPGAKYTTNGQKRIEIFSLVKDDAINLILEYRTEMMQPKSVSSAIADSNDQLDQLATGIKALIARAEEAEKRATKAEANNAELKVEIKAANWTIYNKDKEIETLSQENVTIKSAMRQLMRNEVVTKHARSIAGKVAKVAKTKIVISLR